MKDVEVYPKQEARPPCHLSDLIEVEISSPTRIKRWTNGVCPNCGFPEAAVDPNGILWCPACGYSKKGVYT